MKPLKQFQIQTKLELSFIAMAIAIVAVLTFALFKVTCRQMREDVQTRLHDVASVAVLQMDGDSHAEIRSLADESSPAYIQLEQTLGKILSCNTDFRYVYTCRFNSDGQLVFVGDAEIPGEKKSQIGELYDTEQAVVTLLKNIQEPSVTSDFATDSWGTFLTGYAPFYRSDGQREGVIGIDIEASRILASERRFLWTAMSVFVVTIPVTFVLGKLLGRKLSAPIVALKNAAEALKQGKLDSRVNFRTNDELQDLAVAFNDMADEIESQVKIRTQQLKKEMAAREEADAKIIKAKQELEYTFDSVTDMIAVIDADFKIKRVNKAMAEKFGLTPMEMVGRYCHECIHEDIQPSMNFMQTKYLLDGQPFAMDVYSENLGGFCEVAISPFNQSSELLLNVQVVRDINKRKRIEMELRQAKEEAEAANIAKSEFLANMSHEIRTPMNSIIGFGELLLQEDLGADQQDYCRTILDSAANLMKIINDILDFSRIEARKMEIEYHTLCLPDFMNLVEVFFQPKVQAKQIEFSVSLDDRLPAAIKTDPLRLRQCLVNLVSNAFKFTEMGFIRINVGLHNADSREYIRFDVADTGIGIPADRQEAIFHAFIQADGSSTRKYGGTGLGLTITRKLSELLGGNVTVSSNPGSGSTFSLFIPLITEDALVEA